MGIKELIGWNQSCSMRLLWLLISGAGSLWIALLHAYLLKNRSIWSLPIPLALALALAPNIFSERVIEVKR